ncbi:RNA polymerase sigma factor [uncultured Robinsoniella sp.]|uniref:RNA polymerase sigma factor n=1 Tax=uncultured Robinsoniella sp. TaxID=904190 RepID=UPI00374E464F
MKNEQEAGLAIEKYSDMVRRICFVQLKNYHDVEDVFQDVFLKYILNDKPFDSEVHEKAWMIRVTINACRDNLKSFFKRKVLSINELLQEPSYIEESSFDTLEAVLQLPQKYRNAIYLFYFEGYTAIEIADILGRKENTIYTWLSRGREQLKTALGGEPYGK